MNRMTICLLSTAAPLMVVSAPVLAGGPEFIPLGHLSGGEVNFSQATAISDNGQFVGGHSDGVQPGFTPIVWDGTTLNFLNVPDGFAEGVYINDISGDGQSVVGMGPGPNGFRGVRWDPSGTPHVQNETAFGSHTSLNAINYDGTVAGGFMNQDFFPEMTADAAVWTESGGVQNVGGLPDGNRYASFSDVTNDGSTFVGFASDTLQRPVAWDNDNGFQVLGSVPESTGAGMAISIAPYGGVITGALEVGPGNHPAYWDAGGNAHLINLWDGYTVGEALGVTGDGSTIVGNWRETPYSTESESLAFIWDEDNGARPLQDVLMNDYGMDLGGWTLNHLADITPDGLFMVGTGTNPNGDLEAFKISMATLPAPGALSLFALAAAAGHRRRRI